MAVEFHDYPDLFTTEKQHDKRLRSISPDMFYQRWRDGLKKEMTLQKSTPLHQLRTALASTEHDWYSTGRPYYKIYPNVLDPMMRARFDFGWEHVRLAYKVFAVLFPKGNALKVSGALVAEYQDYLFICVQDFKQATKVIMKMGIYELTVEETIKKKWLTEEKALDFATQSKNMPSDNTAWNDAVYRTILSVTFFSVDDHEFILPDLPRKKLKRYLNIRESSGDDAAAKQLTKDRKHSAIGWSVGAEQLLPTPIIETHDRPEKKEAAKRELSAGHLRRGHMRLQPFGPRNERRVKWIFLKPTLIRPDLPIAPARGHRIKV